jgi:hypothetical protein
MNTANSGDTGHPAPGSDDSGTREREMRLAALRMKAEATDQQIDVVARSMIDEVQAQLEDVAARIAHAGGDTRNELRAREAQLRAELDLARMDLRSLGVAAESQIADEALHNDH